MEKCKHKWKLEGPRLSSGLISAKLLFGICIIREADPDGDECSCGFESNTMVYRRYSEFTLLRRYMQVSRRGRVIPPLRRKSLGDDVLTAMLDEETLRAQWKELHFFLQAFHHRLELWKGDKLVQAWFQATRDDGILPYDYEYSDLSDEKTNGKEKGAKEVQSFQQTRERMRFHILRAEPTRPFPEVDRSLILLDLSHNGRPLAIHLAESERQWNDSADKMISIGRHFLRAGKKLQSAGYHSERALLAAGRLADLLKDDDNDDESRTSAVQQMVAAAAESQGLLADMYINMGNGLQQIALSHYAMAESVGQARRIWDLEADRRLAGGAPEDESHDGVPLSELWRMMGRNDKEMEVHAYETRRRIRRMACHPLVQGKPGLMKPLESLIENLTTIFDDSTPPGVPSLSRLSKLQKEEEQKFKEFQKVQKSPESLLDEFFS